MLKDKIIFYIPDKDKEGNDVSRTRSILLENLTEEFSERFGGCTVSYSDGYYLKGDGSLLEENMLELMVLIDRPTNKGYWTGIISQLKDYLNQETMLITRETIDIEIK